LKADLMIRSESLIDENKKRPERAPERPPWRLLCVNAHRFRRINFSQLLTQ